MIGMGSIIGIGLKLVANREKIAQAWGQIAPAIEAVRKNYPAIKDLIEDIMPGAMTPEPPQSYSVEWLQESLNELGATPRLEVDGEYGEQTKAAVIEYQQAHSLEPDGWAGVATQASIYDELAKVA
jgi:hypothetical protein